MFDRILVPLDGSDYSAQVLWQVRRLLLADDAQVELYTAVIPIQESWFERQGDRPDREERDPSLLVEEARRGLEVHRERLAAAGATVTVEVEVGDPADRILSRVRRTKPALVAMATHGRSGPTSWLRGSVAQRVLRECDAPLLLVNPSAEDEDDVQALQFRTILVPFDGSERAAAVFPLVQQLAQTWGATVVLQRVWPSPELQAPMTAEELAASVEKARSKLAAAGLEVRVRASFGYPPREILTAVEEERADLVAITTHGRTGTSRWFFGSVTEKVLRRCGQPLLVVNTRPAEAED